MLIRLTSDQIATGWDFIKTCIADAGPLEMRGSLMKDREATVLNSMLIGQIQCWVSGHLVEDKTIINGFVLTTIQENVFVGARNLLIYSMVGVNNALTIREWQQGLLTLAQFARKMKCQQIVGYTANQELIRMGKRLGGDVSQTVVVIPLN